MKLILTPWICLFLYGCSSNINSSQQYEGVNHKWMDSIRQSVDTSYVKLYGTSKFVYAEYFINRKDSIICQVMKDSADSIRQIIISKKNKRVFFAEYYPNGQLIGRLPLDSFGQYHGNTKYFYQNGLLETQGEYKNGLKTGIWKHYGENQKLVSTVEYGKNGQPVKNSDQ